MLQSYLHTKPDSISFSMHYGTGANITREPNHKATICITDNTSTSNTPHLIKCWAIWVKFKLKTFMHSLVLPWIIINKSIFPSAEPSKTYLFLSYQKIEIATTNKTFQDSPSLPRFLLKLLINHCSWFQSKNSSQYLGWISHYDWAKFLKQLVLC